MSEHQTEQLGAYVLGVLDPGEELSVQRHLDTCPSCRFEVGELREMEAALGELPPEAFIEGPPDGADLLLQRTLREMRAEQDSGNRLRRVVWSAAAVVVAAAILTGGALLGRSTAPTGTVAQPAPSASASASAPANVTSTDPSTGASMTVALQPAAGWVRLTATVRGVPAGQQCQLVVVAKDGTQRVAGSWLVSAAGEANGTTLNGSALVAPDQVASVQVVNLTGQTFVSVPV
jgi:anti-sigma factor RsiW